MISEETRRLGQRAEADLQDIFRRIDETAQYNTEKVLTAFQAHRVSEACLAGTTGYGYDDLGRETLEAIYADLYGAEDALVRADFVSGTHAISCCLFGALRPGDTLLSAVGAPYDTLRGVIGMTDKGPGSLKDWGVHYRQVDLVDNRPDPDGLAEAAADPAVKAVLIQRSRGYDARASLSVAEIGELCDIVRTVNPGAAILVDNCYGEFVEEREPIEAGADLVVGSMIKNAGGGLAPRGGYIAGRRDLVRAAAARLSCPGIEKECGATLNTNRVMYQGLFWAPHTAAQALKTAVFAARLMELLGFETDPAWDTPRPDIIQQVHMGSPEAVKKFCAGIQAGAPVDSYVTPEPWDMPGYDCPVIMAAGAFIQGSSIELSADAPMREPYTVYLQGGVTYESGKLGILMAADRLLEEP